MTDWHAAVATATAGVQRLYELGKVPAGPTYPYGVYSATLGRGSAYTMDSRHGARLGLVTVQTFGRTVDSATDLMEQVTRALLDKRLPAAGWETTPLRAFLDQPSVNRDPNDNGVITVTMPFNFTATEA